MTPKKRAIPKPPGELGAAGKALWKALHADLDLAWELDARELHLLARACGCADHLAALEAVVAADGVTATGSRGQAVVHPALSEIRQMKLAQARLLSAIEVVDPVEAVRPATPAQGRARRAATKRWTRKESHGT